MRPELELLLIFILGILCMLPITVRYFPEFQSTDAHWIAHLKYLDDDYYTKHFITRAIIDTTDDYLGWQSKVYIPLREQYGVDVAVNWYEQYLTIEYVDYLIEAQKLFLDEEK